MKTKMALTVYVGISLLNLHSFFRLKELFQATKKEKENVKVNLCRIIQQ